MDKGDWPVFQIQFEHGPRDLTVTTWVGPVTREEGPPLTLKVAVFRESYAFLASAFHPDDVVVENAVQTHVYHRIGPSPWDPNLWLYEWGERSSDRILAHEEGAGL